VTSFFCTKQWEKKAKEDLVKREKQATGANVGKTTI